MVDHSRVPPAARRSALAALVVALSALLPQVAPAADADGKFAAKGVALTRCEAFVQARESRRDNPQLYVLFGGWLEGYISAVNEREPATYDLTSFESTELLATLLHANCQRNPEQPFFNVVRGLVGALKQTRIASESALVPVTGTVPSSADGESREVTLRLYTETVRRLQNALKTLGHYDGAVDGAYGPGTRAGVSAFQASTGLTVNGMPDQFTLLRLFRPPPSQPVQSPSKAN